MGYEHNSMVARKLFEIIEYHDNFISVFMFFLNSDVPQFMDAKKCEGHYPIVLPLEVV